MGPSSPGRRRRLLPSEQPEAQAPATGGKRRPCRDDGDGEFDRFYVSVRKADRDCNIELPPSPNAIMRRATHPPRREQRPRQEDPGELDAPTPQSRKKNRHPPPT